MKILAADKFEEIGLQKLREIGCAVALEPGLNAETLAEGIARNKPDVLIVRSTKVTAPALQAAKNLSLIIRAGAGYDTIDIQTASALGIFVANCPGKNSIAVAELTMALILACDRAIPDATADLRAGRWRKGVYSKASGLCGRTLGIIGRGAIALEVACRARSFGMPIVMWSRSLTDDQARELDVVRAPDITALARAADVVSLHLAAAPETKGLINADFFSAMKDGACFINTSRGSLVDYEALRRAVETKRLKVGLDVFEREPGGAESDFNDPLLALPGVYATPHIGASTDQAQAAIALETVRIIRVCKETGNIPNVVNLCGKSSDKNILIVRHLNKPGVLAHVLGALSEAGINVEEMDNHLYAGEKAACAKIHLAGAPAPEVMAAIGGKPEILSATLK